MLKRYTCIVTCRQAKEREESVHKRLRPRKKRGGAAKVMTARRSKRGPIVYAEGE